MEMAMVGQRKINQEKIWLVLKKERKMNRKNEKHVILMQKIGQKRCPEAS